MSNPPVTVNVIGIDVTYITSAEVNSELWGQKCTIGLLRFQREGEGKNNEYETKLLHSLIHFTLKATTKWRLFFRRWDER
jgi:hypothetical protein